MAIVNLDLALDRHLPAVTPLRSLFYSTNVNKTSAKERSYLSIGRLSPHPLGTPIAVVAFDVSSIIRER